MLLRTQGKELSGMINIPTRASVVNTYRSGDGLKRLSDNFTKSHSLHGLHESFYETSFLW